MAKRTVPVLLVLILGAVSARGQEIFEAVKNNDLAKVQALAAQETSLAGLKDGLGNTPLHTAAIVGSVPIAAFLLSKGADINAANDQASTPLHTAIANKHEEVAALLIEKGAGLDRRDQGGNAPLHVAASANSPAIAELLISKGADLEAKNASGYTPLGALTRSTSNFEAAEALVRHGADVNAPWKDGSTPLNNAALYSSGRVIDLLLDHGADFDAAGENGWFILSAAVDRGHVRLLRRIVEKRGESVFGDAEANKGLMRGAIVSGSLEMVEILRSHKVPLELSAGLTGATPLHGAAGNPEALGMIEFLVRNGADINARTNDGRSAYNVAETAGNTRALDLILKLGGNAEPQKFPSLTGPYMGQAPPGGEPKAFAPGIVQADHSTISVSPGGGEMYWGNGTSILCSKLRDGRWTKPDYAPFSGPRDRAFYDDVPFVSPDDRRLFFTSLRPVGALEANSSKENIWVAERTDGGWSEPRPVGAAVNALALHWQVSVSSAGTLFFGGRDQNSLGGGDIYYSRLVDGEYAKPVNAGPAINTSESETMPFIAPDESYLIFFRALMQRPHLYISFKAKDGQWLPPQEIDRYRAGVCAMVSPDGKYLFVGDRWVSAAFIEQMRPK